MLVGDPGYYKRFGFRSYKGLAFDGVPQDNVLALPFEENKVQGLVIFLMAQMQKKKKMAIGAKSRPICRPALWTWRRVPLHPPHAPGPA